MLTLIHVILLILYLLYLLNLNLDSTKNYNIQGNGVNPHLNPNAESNNQQNHHSNYNQENIEKQVNIDLLNKFS